MDLIRWFDRYTEPTEPYENRLMRAAEDARAVGDFQHEESLLREIMYRQRYERARRFRLNDSSY